MIKLIKKLLIVLCGSFLMSVGISSFIKAEVGIDPLGCFTLGVAKQLELSYGQTTYLIMGTIVLCLLIVDKKRVGIATIVNAICIGLFVDKLLMIPIQNPQFFLLRILVVVIGVIFLGTGIGVYITSGMGEGAVEAVMMLLHNKTQFSLKNVRIVMDILMLTIGGFLGAKIGIGTAIGMVFTGPILDWILRTIRPSIEQFIEDDIKVKQEVGYNEIS